MTRKHILRTVLEEIIVTVDGNQIGLRLHWKGGDHTELAVRKNRHRHTRWTIDTDTELLIRELARLHVRPVDRGASEPRRTAHGQEQ